MPFYTKIIIGGAIIITVLVSMNLAVNFWIDQQLPNIISDHNKSPYHITYKDLDIDLWTGNCTATDVVVVPKAAVKDSLNKAGIYAKIEFVEIERVKILEIIFKDKIRAEQMKLIRPHITLYKKNEKVLNNSKNIRAEIVEPFKKIITVSNIDLDNGDFKMIDVTNKTPILSAKNIALHIGGLLITDDILKRKIPFEFQSYVFGCSDFYFRTNELYHLEAKSIAGEKNGLHIQKFAFVSQYNRRQFVKRLKTEKDLYTVTANAIQLRDLHWGFKNEKLFIDARAAVLDRVSANIYRSKLPPDNRTKKHLHSYHLRSIPFPLKLDTLIVNNSRLVYEEKIDSKKGSGFVSFDKFNLNARHIQSGFGQKKMPDLKININCRFMNSAPLRVNWSFNVLDRTDGFKIKGKLYNFDTKRISSFFRPYMGMEADGVFDEVSFDLSGNDQVSRGVCGLKYHDFKLTLYKKRKPDKESKLKTAIANILIKDDSDGESKQTKVEVKRIPEKSFYNFLWRSVAAGIKQILW